MAYKCSYCQSTNHKGINCSLRPKPDEIWQLKMAGTGVKIQIIGYFQMGGLNYFDSECIETNNVSYILGATYSFRPVAFVKAWKLCEDVPNTQPQSSVTYGAQCIKCKQDFPYADAVGEFECWSCKNGF